MKMYFLFETGIFHCYLSLPESNQRQVPGDSMPLQALARCLASWNQVLCNGDPVKMRAYLEDHFRTRKWLMTMGCSPSKWTKWLYKWGFVMVILWRWGGYVLGPPWLDHFFLDSELNSLTSTSQYFFCILKRSEKGETSHPWRCFGSSGTEHTFVCLRSCFFTFYHGKSQFFHHLGIYFFPTKLSKSKYINQTIRRFQV